MLVGFATRAFCTVNVISPTCVLLDGGSCATLSIEADSCENYSNSKYESTANDLKSNYKNVYKLMQDIEDAYDDLTDALKTSNEKLEKMINVTKNKLLQEKKLIFLLKQHNQLYENNAIMIRPNSNFRVANLTIIYKLEDKNQVLNILATFYEKNKELDKLNLVYAYSNIQKLDDLEVINAYIRENGKFPTKKYSYIQINDVAYRIVEDDKYGNIFVNQKKYRVDNNTIYK